MEDRGGIHRAYVSGSARLSSRRRLARPDQMAAVAVFLASDAVSFVNGAIVPVDAGWSAG
ncbi:SDR family oxidoreductase [Nocardia rhamnosiphila]|uniref:SDR family oxidoreductase n=1 Tax=Nocardia rhamnosiphila TaxID=426716 RepID=UPI0033EC3331